VPGSERMDGLRRRVFCSGLGSGEGAVQAVPAAMGSNGKRRLRLLSGRVRSSPAGRGVAGRTGDGTAGGEQPHGGDKPDRHALVSVFGGLRACVAGGGRRALWDRPKLTQWGASRVLQGGDAVGLVCVRWKEDDVRPSDLTMAEVLRDRCTDRAVPLVGHLPVGHGRPNMALPLGHLARLNGQRGLLELL